MRLLADYKPFVELETSMAPSDERDDDVVVYWKIQCQICIDVYYCSLLDRTQSITQKNDH